MPHHAASPRFRAAVVAIGLLVAVVVFPAISRGAIISFGDSLSDAGSAYIGTEGLLPPTPPYFQGRFTNGPIWLDHLATHLGQPVPTSFLAGGTNYAVGGANTGFGLSSLGAPAVGDQINTYLALHTPAPGDLFTLWAGANDFYSGQTDPAAVVANLMDHVAALHAAGARRFLVPNLVPLGLAPDTVNTPGEPVLNGLALSYNLQLAAALSQFAALHPETTIHQLNIDGLVLEILATPLAFGFTNLTQPAFDANAFSVVPNPDNYVFWDNVHPTAAVHQIIGDRAAALVIPAPAAALALLLLLPAAARRRGRAATL